MLPMKRPRLRSAHVLSDFRLALTFINGQELTVDLGMDIHTYPGLRTLLDREVFATAAVGDEVGSLNGLNPTYRSVQTPCIWMR